MTELKHSPLPFEVQEYTGTFLIMCNDKSVAGCNKKEDADFLCNAGNNHAKLLEAAKIGDCLLDVLYNSKHCLTFIPDMPRHKIKKAITEAEKEVPNAMR